jgi:hypothetical protein
VAQDQGQGGEAHPYPNYKTVKTSSKGPAWLKSKARALADPSSKTAQQRARTIQNALSFSEAELLKLKTKEQAASAVRGRVRKLHLAPSPTAESLAPYATVLWESAVKARESYTQNFGVEADLDLLARLSEAITLSQEEARGYLYLKAWKLPDGSCWFKVGITNDPRRRDAEQNVLPVSPENLALAVLPGMDRAKVVEKAIHRVLDACRITGAKNKELFRLKPAQVSALVAVIRNLR